MGSRTQRPPESPLRRRAGWLAVAGLAVLTCFAAPSLWAGELRFSGSAALELRFFLDDPAFPGQDEAATQPSITVQPEWRYSSEDGRHKLSFIPFARWDARDEERSHVDLREAHYLYVGESWELLAGVDKVFWGVTESLHLVDVINQTDLVEEVDGEDKLGQPMVRLTANREWGTLSLFVLPAFRERTFPGAEGRLRPPIPVDTDRPLYESSAEQNHLDLALRYSHYFGNWDLGAYYFRGTGREPRLLPRASGSLPGSPLPDSPPPGGPFPGNLRLVPFYDQIQQAGLDLQYTREAWLWKLEAIGRQGQGKTFAAVVAGFEYTFFQLGNGASDLGLLLELLYDGRDATAPVTLFEDDLFVGARWARNDLRDTALLAGTVLDRAGGGLAAFLEAQTRLADGWTIELEARLFTGAEADDPLFAVQADDFLTLRLARYF